MKRARRTRQAIAVLGFLILLGCAEVGLAALLDDHLAATILVLIVGIVALSLFYPAVGTLWDERPASRRTR
jgi:hypothetical protein